MMRKLTDADRIDVRRHCSVAWDSMSGDDRKRFCRECNKQVHNLSRMTRGEIESFLAVAEKGFCARFTRRADGTVESADSLPESTVVARRIPLRTIAPLSAVLGLCASVFAQSSPNAAKSERQRPPYVLRREHARKDQERAKVVAMHGTIFDPLDAAISRAAVTLFDETTKQEYSTTTDDEGKYRFSNMQPGSYTFTVKATGFQVFSKSRLDLRVGEEVRLDATLQVGALMGEIVTVKKDGPLAKVSKVLLFPYRALRREAGGSR